MEFELRDESTAPDAGFFLWDFTANRIHGDDAWLALHGFTDQDVIAGISIQSVIDRIHPDDSVRIGRAMPATIMGHGSYLEDYRIITPDGKTVLAQSTGRVFANETGPTFCTGIVFPIEATGSRSPREIVRELCSSAYAVARASADADVAERLEDLLIFIDEPPEGRTSS